MGKIKRIDEIDILKSIGIVLMIMGHIGFGIKFDFWIHSFHMPIFYIISGFLYKKKNISFITYLIKKIRSLIIPYMFFSTFHIAIMLNMNWLNIDNLIAVIWMNTDNMPIAGGLWFFTSLFFMDIIIFGLEKCHFSLKCLFIIFFGILGYMLPYYFRLPWALDTSLVGILLFYIGVVIKKYIFILKTNLIYGSICIIFGSIFCFSNGYVNVREGFYSNFIIFICGSILFFLGFFIFSKQFAIQNGKIIQELKFIGQNSLVYVSLNQIIIMLFGKIQVYFEGIGLRLFIFKIIECLAILFILKYISKLLDLDYLKWIKGKSRCL